MSSPGTDAGQDRPLDPNLAKALSHPLRHRILERLSAGGEASPNQLAKLLDAPLSNVAYHVRVLLDLGCIELVGTRQRRGALEHSYRSDRQPLARRRAVGAAAGQLPTPNARAHAARHRRRRLRGGPRGRV